MSWVWRNRRAITPVLSTVLLMVIAVAGMSIAMTATYVITGNLRETMGERYIVEDIWFRTGGISVYLRNIGKSDIDFAAVYIDHVPRSFPALHLDPGQHGWLNVTHYWSLDTVYHINIVTNRGTQIADYYRSPK